MIEQEIKRALSFNQYKNCLDRLLQLASFQKRYIQVNNYYDTPDFGIYKNAETLRIRQKDETLTIEYKNNKRIIGEAHVCIEYSTPISDMPNEIILSHYFSQFTDVTQCRLLGSLTTERIDFLYDRMIISLDKNLYLGKVDYEIEIEFENSDSSQLIMDLQLDKAPTSLNKYSRFTAQYCQMTKFNIS